MVFEEMSEDPKIVYPVSAYPVPSGTDIFWNEIQGDTSTLLIIGASVRSAAFSALRTRMQPLCADLFADADLTARCRVIRVSAVGYPQSFQQVVEQNPPGPWMYTGALENRPGLVRALAQRKPLWGNDEQVLARARSPQFLARLLTEEGILGPSVVLKEEDVPSQGRWLVKPLAGAGGTGIRFWDPSQENERGKGSVYFQKFVAGPAHAAVFLGDAQQAQLLGITRQLVGENWLHAAPFHYCGSIFTSIANAACVARALEKLGNVLVQGCGLRGLFGVDFVLRDGAPWLIEVNPRYTASVEVLEYAQGTPALALHRAIFDPTASRPSWSVPAGQAPAIGKAILFAQAPLIFPEEGPWRAVLDQPGPIEEMPAFADIPRAGEHIRPGHPILSFFARADTEQECMEKLRHVAADLDRIFFGS